MDERKKLQNGEKNSSGFPLFRNKNKIRREKLLLFTLGEH